MYQELPSGSYSFTPKPIGVWNQYLRLKKTPLMPVVRVPFNVPVILDEVSQTKEPAHIRIVPGKVLRCPSSTDHIELIGIGEYFVNFLSQKGAGGLRGDYQVAQGLFQAPLQRVAEALFGFVYDDCTAGFGQGRGAVVQVVVHHDDLVNDLGV